jgi:hypothetical protein
MSSRVALLREIKRLIESLPQRPDELGFAGETEQRIAIYYLRLGDEVAAGDWWVRAALEAERYGQLTEGCTILELAIEKLPQHLALRRELARLKERVPKTD